MADRFITKGRGAGRKVIPLKGKTGAGPRAVCARIRKDVAYPMSPRQFRAVLGKAFEDTGQLDCYILLSIGRSSKTFLSSGDRGVTVIHEIDDTTVEYGSMDQMLANEPMIRKALDQGWFFLHSYETGRYADTLKKYM